MTPPRSLHNSPVLFLQPFVGERQLLRMRLLERLPGLPRRLRETVTARPRQALAWCLRKPSFTASTASLSNSSCLRAVGLQLTSLALGQACVFRRWRLLVPSARRFFEDSGLALSRTTLRTSITGSADRDRCLEERRAINAQPRPPRVKDLGGLSFLFRVMPCKTVCLSGFYLILPTQIMNSPYFTK